MDLSFLPPELQARGISIGNEIAWPACIARDLVAHFEGANLAILGVEILLVEGTPRVWGWSEYEVEFDGDWAKYVRETCARARAELRKEIPRDALVQMTVAELPTSR